MPLRIAVCNAQVPFEYGGAEVLTDALITKLREWGHEVELVRLPFRHFPREEIIKGYLAWRLVNLEESEGRTIDRVIALKFPAFVLSHPYKITWLVHQLRQVYDLFGTNYGFLSDSAEDTGLRELVRRVDTRTIGESRHVFAISGNVSGRLRRFNHLEAEVLYPPPAMDGSYYNHGYGDYVLSVSRLNLLKRVDQLVKAMAHVVTPVRCIIVGQGHDLEDLEALAKQVGSAERIDFRGFVSDEDKLRLYAEALAVYYAPLDEDYGLATIEAMKSSKSVVTTSDSGGVLEFAEDRVTGMVTPPGNARAMAERIDELYDDRRLAEQMGSASLQRVAGLTWDATIRRLLEV